MELLNSIHNGAQLTIDKKEELNSINIFPVADADTGTNISSLMQALLDFRISNNSTIKEVLVGIADAAILGSRGNSGLIFSQFLNGLSEGFNELKEDETSFIKASSIAAKKARESLIDPKEGTIISVMDAWANSLNIASSKNSFESSLIIAEKACKNEVDNTKIKNKLLKKNNIVDSGALAFYYFINGFTSSYLNKKVKLNSNLEIFPESMVNNDVSFQTKEPEKRYCSEFIVAPEQNNLDLLKERLSYFGDSIVVGAMSSDRIKIHIHTNTPSLVLESLVKYGKIKYQKVDDMLLQYMISNNDESEIAVVTDSIADLPSDFLLQKKVSVLPMNISLDGDQFLDKITTNSDYFYTKLDIASGNTSQPSIPSIDSLFSYLEGKYKHVIVITVSSQLSGTYQLVKQRIKEKGYDSSWIQVIDSKLNSVAQGLIVQNAVQIISEGCPFKETIREIESSIERTFIYVSINDLSYMIKSGRIPTRLGKWAKKLSLFPVISLNKKGNGVLKGIYFTRLMSIKAVMKKINKMEVRKEIESLGIAYTTKSDDVKSILSKINSEKVSYSVISSASILINAGKGSIAIAGIKRRK